MHQMLRSLFSIASIFTLLLPTFISPASAFAARRFCPDEPPKTLLSLYRSSDSIHIGRYDRLEEGAISEDTEDYTAVDIKKHFSISSTLKGEPVKLFALEEKDYRYKNQEVSEHGEEAEGEGLDDLYMPKLEPGDAVILFLKKGEGEDAPLVLTEWTGSLKKVTKEELDAYERRLNELNSIFGGKKVSDQAIVRWLVDAARDPNTRWEGAFELFQSFQSAEWKKQRDEQLAEMRKNGEKVEDEIVSDEIDNSVYSTLLTDAQKSELMNIVLESQPDKDALPTSRQKRGDGVLIDLVSRWGDTRFATFLVDRLRNSTVDNHYERYDLMSKISEALKDEQLSSISSKFSEVTYQEDDAVQGDAEEPQNRVDGDGNGDVVEDPQKPKITYKQIRDDLIAKFLSRSDAVLAKAQNAESAKLANNVP